MDIVQNVTSFLNPGQIPVMACDCLIFAKANDDVSVQNPLSSNEIEPSLLFENYSNLLSYTSWILKKTFASTLHAGGGISPSRTLLLEPNCNFFVITLLAPPSPKKLSTPLH